MPGAEADNGNRPALDAGRADGAARVMRPRSASRGFTLLEIILVMAIIALASVLAAAAMGGGFRGMQLRANAQKIASNLRFTRAQAISTGQPQRFVIDPHAHAWHAPKSHHGKIPPKLGIAFVGAREVQSQPGEGAIAFFPDGASTGGRIQLTSGKAMWTVDVAWLTGQVQVTHGAVGQ
jgi:general secretion pathway protein H